MLDNEFIKKINTGWIYAVFTDRTVVASWPDESSKAIDEDELLLECRIFDADREYRMFRMNISDEFKVREIEDGDEEKDSIFDERQFLNRFDRAILNKNRLIVRNYIEYDENGQAYISKWRMVGFE